MLIVPSTSGDGGGLARAALATEPDGAVVGTLGAGHLAPAVLDLWAEAAERIPVIAYCRPERGVILNSTYGYAGSERDLRETNIIPTGFLSPQAARMKLLACLGAGPLDRRGALGVSPGRRLGARRGAAACCPAAVRNPRPTRSARAPSHSSVTRLCPVKGRNGLPSAPVSVSTADAGGSTAVAVPRRRTRAGVLVAGRGQQARRALAAGLLRPRRPWPWPPRSRPEPDGGAEPEPEPPWLPDEPDPPEPPPLGALGAAPDDPPPLGALGGGRS